MTHAANRSRRDRPGRCPAPPAAALWGALALLLAGCGSAGVERLPEPADEDPPGAPVRLFFATDRAPTGETNPAVWYGAERGALRFGRAEVGISPQRRPPPAARRGASAPEDIPGAARMIELLEIVELTEERFLEAIWEPGEDVFVFIHGYNAHFAQAATWTGRIARETGFAGVPIFYSWPSQGTVAGYVADLNNAEWSALQLETFLESLIETRPRARIHIIAHSMGNRTLFDALSGLRARYDGPAPVLGQLVLVAPDIDAALFAVAVPGFRELAENVTLYVSGDDIALRASKLGAGGYARAGDSSDGVLVVHGIETVDVTAVGGYLLGHEYHRHSRAVVRDIALLLQTGAPAAERPGLLPRVSRDGPYWTLAR